MAQQVICAQCQSIVKPRSDTKGSCLVEGALWLLFIVPGLIYSLWRLSSKAKACPVCGGTELVPLDTPRGRALAAERQG